MPKVRTKSEFDYIIPVMGPTGAGKSTFINLLMEKAVARVGHSLNSCTTDLEPFEIQADMIQQHLPAWVPVLLNRSKLIVVDTPGFDNADADDSEILKRVATWLAQSYGANAKLAGVIYLHDISQRRVIGGPKLNFEVLDRLCGVGGFKSIVLGTTQWTRILDDEQGVAEAREQELRNRFWKDMIGRGSSIQRVDDRKKNTSPWNLVETILARSKSTPMILVLGMTGVGKSTFICSARPKRMQPKIHNGLSSSQAPVEEFEVESEDGQIISLVDTPGFNDTDRSDRMVLNDIITFLKSASEHRKVTGIIYLLDASNRDYAPISAHRLGAPPSLVVATVSCHANAPVSDEVKPLLKNKYGAAYQGDHFGSTDQYQTAWSIIRRVLNSDKGEISVQLLVRSLEDILQNRMQKGETIRQTFLKKLFHLILG